MHILPGFLILCLAAGPASAAGSPALKTFAGSWKGSVTTETNGCVWQVNGLIKEKAGHGSGNFSYTGPCDGGIKTGTFSAKPGGGGCYSATVALPGLPPLPVTACFGPPDTLTFDSMMVKGTLKLSDHNNKADLRSQSLAGAASGSFKRVVAAPAAAGKGKKHEKTSKPVQTEVLIGSY